MNGNLFKTYKDGDTQLSAKDLNAVRSVLSGLMRSSVPNGFVGAHGINQRNSPNAVKTKLFTVVSNAVGGGVYNCRELKVDYANWATEGQKLSFHGADETEVLNLAENNTAEHSLVVDDLLVAIAIKDQNGSTRYVGVTVASVAASITMGGQISGTVTIETVEYLQLSVDGQSVLCLPYPETVVSQYSVGDWILYTEAEDGNFYAFPPKPSTSPIFRGEVTANSSTGIITVKRLSDNASITVNVSPGAKSSDYVIGHKIMILQDGSEFHAFTPNIGTSETFKLIDGVAHVYFRG